VTVLVVVEHEDGRLTDTSRQAATFAHGLAQAEAAPLAAVAFGPEAAMLAEDVGSSGAATLTVLDEPTVYAPSAWAAGVATVVEDLGAATVCAPGTDRGNEVMAHVAARMGLPLAVNCTEARPGPSFEVTRLRWGGILLEDALIDGAIRLLTVAPHHVQPSAPGDAAATVRRLDLAIDPADLRVQVGEQVANEAGVTLATAPVVVSGGRGVGSADGFGLLEELAALLGGAVGCSRVATNNGWRPHSDQVGQTGSRVAPEVYLACGISGATQHWVGCMASKTIIAINTDPEAPMVTRAHYAVLGDVHEVLPAVTAAVRARRQQRATR
jgi:electron transfer flavoprotein alpha subunit